MRSPCGANGHGMLLHLLAACAVAGAVMLFQPVDLEAQMTSAECLECHADPDIAKEVEGRSVSVHVDSAAWATSIHSELDCTGCHSDVSDYPHPDKVAKVECSQCHDDAQEAWARSVHGKALNDKHEAAPTCLSCHGGNPHAILPSSNPRSPTNHANIPRTCGACHSQKFVMEPSGFSVMPFFNYQESVHGRAVARGSTRAAVCIDCHNAHGVTNGADPESPIFKLNIPMTCGKCHSQESKDFLASVHGQAVLRGNWSSPVCTDCHGIHNIRQPTDPNSSVSAKAVASTTCAHCHGSVRLTREFGIKSRRVSSYQGSYHGLGTRVGNDVVANCASCHGVHNILPSSDPRSTVNKKNLKNTCGVCHPGATDNFIKGEVHLGVGTVEDTGSRVVWWIRTLYITLIVLTIGFMLVHNVLSWYRKAIAKRKQKNRTIVRMDGNQRIQHLLLLVSFTILAVTGFALAFPNSGFSFLIGESERTRRWIHRIAASVMLGVGAYHVVYMLATREGRKGLRDFWFSGKDLRDLLANFRFFLGRTRKAPRMGRFTYAEKAEYWALIWGTMVMGVTGIMLWAQTEVGSAIPRWWLDIATAIHFWEAVLATLAIVVWHLYQVIFDPEVYPMNWSWYDGRMSEDDYEHEHALHYDELKESGALKSGNGGSETEGSDQGAGDRRDSADSEPD